MKIGIFDSGIGGLTNLFELEKRYPNHYIYVADQKNSPYGIKDKQQLLRLAIKVVRFLISQNCKIIIIACNTICANVLNDLIELFPQVKFIGVIEPTIEIINQSLFETILLIATPATIRSQAYLKNNHKSIIPLATPDFVPAIESMNDALIDELIRYYLSSYRSKIDAICLGCTHYPLIKEKIANYLNVPIIDSVQALNATAFSIGKSNLTIYTTLDEVKLQYQIETLFQRKIYVKKLEELDESYYTK